MSEHGWLVRTAALLVCITVKRYITTDKYWLFWLSLALGSRRTSNSGRTGMTTIVVIEPHTLLRLGILQILADISTACSIKGEDYSVFARKPSDTNCDLVLLSIPSFEERSEEHTSELQ